MQNSSRKARRPDWNPSRAISGPWDGNWRPLFYIRDFQHFFDATKTAAYPFVLPKFFRLLRN